jgi:hypothetical protein
MSNLIVILLQILSQILFLAAVLSVIFPLIDKAILIYRRTRSRYQPAWEEKERIRQVKYKQNLSGIGQLRRNSLFSGNWQQLVTKVNGDSATAERLIYQLRSRYPEKSDEWYIEKAIHDLERDKGRH